MNDENQMDRLAFLLGAWNLEYRIPKSAYSEPAKGTGYGTFKKALHDRYIFFDYTSRIDDEEGGAHGVFKWDEKTQCYRYWWFESSGEVMKATCRLLDDKTLFMNWHDSLLRQTFTRKNPDKIILRMEEANAKGTYDMILEVIFTRKSGKEDS